MDGMGPDFLALNLVPMLIGMVVFIIPAWAIAAKTGRHGAISLLIFLPFIGGIIYMAILAFGRWPATDGED